MKMYRNTRTDEIYTENQFVDFCKAYIDSEIWAENGGERPTLSEVMLNSDDFEIIDD